VNGLFFQVFNTFLIDIGEKIGRLPVMSSLLSEFIGEIRFSNYLLIIVSIIMLGICEVYIIKYNTIQAKQKIYITIAAIGIFILPVPVATYYDVHPKDTWWEAKAKAQDIGIIGHFYTQVFTHQQVDVAVAQVSEGSSFIEKTTELLAQLAKSDETEVAEQNSTSSLYEQKPHIIIYQLESVDSWGIENHDPSPMPFLQSLIAKNIHPEQGFANSCQTINAEFAILCSAYVEANGAISASGEENEYHCLPEILKERYEYHTAYYHSNTPEFWSRNIFGPKWGFDDMHFSPEYDVRYPDRYVIKDIVKSIETSTGPTLNYLVGYTSHAPHSPEQMAELNKLFNINITMYDGKVDPTIVQEGELNEFAVRAYLGFLQEIDDTIKELFDSLKEKHLDENTIVVLTGDHRYYNFSKQTADNFVRYNQVPLVIVSPKQVTQPNISIASHIDIAPTLLQIIEGEQMQKPKNFFGTSMLAAQPPNFAYTKCINEIDFINDNTILRGSAENGLYNTLKGTKEEKEHYTPLLIPLTETTDQLIYQNLLNKKDTN